ncbi:Glycosyl transferases group 1 [Anaerohalosphaera lusitana]|uniref:tRNA-queuosine alpha-mannosyltransferase n=1 Tax=Anaerohalosphaera lusitana TaxID=1936003 RepID=A0A1U9NRF5_9BACT|nr:DUF3524 domain-containing protein [Anaerohalosphaera lusitana]AQT70200.1 Glycosyl transferases group 1 [Anaerohalosphaera lusitana]
MRILALESYYGGSHKAFLDGWISRSRHDWTLLTLPPSKWKWRMRHSAITFAERVNALAESGGGWDAIFCSDMLNLAEFVGLLRPELQRLPRIAYFHENQLTYPVRFESERDYNYVMTNATTALCADAVWFNTHFHRDEFIDEMRKFMKRMPDEKPIKPLDAIPPKSQVKTPGIGVPSPVKNERKPGPLRILWAARWEHDKNPEDFFAAMTKLKKRGTDFRLSVIGEQFRDMPEVFEHAKTEFADRIDRWGYQPSRGEYIEALHEADVVVSTADHEFFGISMVEAIACGAYPVLPDRLAYPEVVSTIETFGQDDFLYDGKVASLVAALDRLAWRIKEDNLWLGNPHRGITAMQRFAWDKRATAMDDAVDEMISKN